MLGGNLKSIATEMGGNQGKLLSLVKSRPYQITNNQLSLNDGITDGVENTELVIVDPKRRRTDQPSGSGSRDVIAQDKDTVIDSQDTNEENQKNSQMVGAAWQTRQDL